MKVFVTAKQAAELLEAPVAAVEADVRAGMSGALASLIGGYSGDWCLVYTFELVEPRLGMHRRRLADAGSGGLRTTDRKENSHDG